MAPRRRAVAASAGIAITPKPEYPVAFVGALEAAGGGLVAAASLEAVSGRCAGAQHDRPRAGEDRDHGQPLSGAPAATEAQSPPPSHGRPAAAGIPPLFPRGRRGTRGTQTDRATGRPAQSLDNRVQTVAYGGYKGTLVYPSPRTTNLRVRSSNLFGRATKFLENQRFPAIHPEGEFLFGVPPHSPKRPLFGAERPPKPRGARRPITMRCPSGRAP